MVCDTVHEFYHGPRLGPVVYSSPSTRVSTAPSKSTSQARAGLSSAGTDTSQCLSISDLEERFEAVHDARRSASEKLREALKIQITKQAPAYEGGTWTEPSDIRPIARVGPLRPLTQRPRSSDSAPSSQPGLNELGREEASRQSVYTVDISAPIRDNRVIANEWISECTPKVWLLDNEKEIWVQHKELERRRWRTHMQSLQKIRTRKMPFDDWLQLAKAAEQMAEEEDFEQQQQVVIAEVKVKEKKQQAERTQKFVSELKKISLPDIKRIMQEQCHFPDWQKCFQKLAEEYMIGKCDIMYTPSGAVERIVHIAVLSLESRDGHFLVQLGSWSQGKVVPTCLLPAQKQKNGEGAEEAVQRLLKQEFSVLGSNVKLGATHTQTHWKNSPSYGVRTKYIRSVVSVKLEISVQSVPFVKATRKETACSLNPVDVPSGMVKQDSHRGSYMPTEQPILGQNQQPHLGHLHKRSGSFIGRDLSSHLSSRFRPAHKHEGKNNNQVQTCDSHRCKKGPKTYANGVPEMYMLWHGDEIELCAWVTNEEFEYLRGHSGERQLKFWLSTVSVDPTLMPPKPTGAWRPPGGLDKARVD